MRPAGGTSSACRPTAGPAGMTRGRGSGRTPARSRRSTGTSWTATATGWPTTGGCSCRCATWRGSTTASSRRSADADGRGAGTSTPERRAGVRGPAAAHTRGPPGYLTARTTSDPAFGVEQVENFCLRMTALDWVGGNTFIPAAVTALQLGIAPVSTTPTEALCCLPGLIVTVRTLAVPVREAGAPICSPRLVTAETPG